MEKTETHILTEIAAGNKLAFEQLFFQYQPQLVAFLLTSSMRHPN